jgi:hypothetical protein
VTGTVLGCVALLMVGAATALWFRAALALRLPENRSAFMAAWLGGALLGLVALFRDPGWAGGAPAVLAIVGGCFLTFTVAISRQQVAPGAVAVGGTLPDFEAPDEHDALFNGASLAGQPVLIKFFRGHW